MSGIDEQVDLAYKILNGKIKKVDVEKELERISKKYGDNCFNSYTVKRKPQPWSEKDLKDLGNLSASGAASKEFYRYMAEVSEQVYAQKATRKKIYTGIGIIAVIVAIAIVIFGYKWLNSSSVATFRKVWEVPLDSNKKIICTVTLKEV